VLSPLRPQSCCTSSSRGRSACDHVQCVAAALAAAAEEEVAVGGVALEAKPAALAAAACSSSSSSWSSSHRSEVGVEQWPGASCC